MAKLNVEFDTESKEMKVKFDGKDVPNVYNISLSKGGYYSDEDENSFGLCLMTMDRTKKDSEGYQSMTQICAKQGIEAVEAVAKGAGTHPEHDSLLLLKVPTDKVNKSLSEYMKTHRTQR